MGASHSRPRSATLLCLCLGDVVAATTVVITSTSSPLIVVTINCCCPPEYSNTTHKVLVCGPPGMMRAVAGDKAGLGPEGQGRVSGLLAKRGFRSSMVYKY